MPENLWSDVIGPCSSLSKSVPTREVSSAFTRLAQFHASESDDKVMVPRSERLISRYLIVVSPSCRTFGSKGLAPGRFAFQSHKVLRSDLNKYMTYQSFGSQKPRHNGTEFDSNSLACGPKLSTGVFKHRLLLRLPINYA